MFTTDQRPKGSLKVPNFHAEVFGMPDQNELQSIAERIQADEGFYIPLVIPELPDDDGLYPVLKDVRIFLALRDILNYQIFQVAPIDVSPEDQPMMMIFLEERRMITRRNLVNMFPIMEEHHERVIRPTRPNNRDHNRDKHVWMSEQCKKLGCPIGLRNIEKLMYINTHRPSLLDLLGVDNSIHPVWKKLFDEMEGKAAEVDKPENASNAPDNSQQTSEPSDLSDDDESESENSPHGQEEVMKSYFGKQFCNPCRANWIWFIRINPIEPLEGGAL